MMTMEEVMRQYWWIGVVVIIVIGVIIIKARDAADKKRAEEEQKRRETEAKEAQMRKERTVREEHERHLANLRQEAARWEKAGGAPVVPQAYMVSSQETEAHGDNMNILEFNAQAKGDFVAVDVETTGLDYSSDAIIEIAAVRVRGGQIVDEFSTYVDPGRPISAEASRVNHITDSMVNGKPRIAEVLPYFLAFVGDDVMVAHNAMFDWRFICTACMRNRYKYPRKIFDSMKLARYWPDAQDKQLGTLLAAAGIVNTRAHSALGDARALAQFVLATNAQRKKK